MLYLILVKNYKKRFNVDKCLSYKLFLVKRDTVKTTEIHSNVHLMEELNTDIKKTPCILEIQKYYKQNKKNKGNIELIFNRDSDDEKKKKFRYF